MPDKHWRDLDAHLRQAIVFGAAVDAALTIISLVDLAQRPRESVRGPKLLWAATLTLVHSGGALPIIYLWRGRRPASKTSP